MRTYRKRFWFYHKRFLTLYVLLLVGVYGVAFFHLPTPASLVLKPFGLHLWSAGLTRASLRLVQGDLIGAYHYNPLIFPLVGFIFAYLFLFPILPNNVTAMEKYQAFFKK